MSKKLYSVLMVLCILAIMCVAALNQVQLFGWSTSDNDWLRVKIDPNTSSLPTVTYSHHKIHDGCSFTAQISNSVTNTGEQTVLGFATPNTTEWVHLFVNATATAWSSLTICETTSIDPNEGKEITAYNRNRNSNEVSSLLNLDDATVADPDPNSGQISYYLETAAAAANITETTEIYHEDIGSTGNPQSANGGVSRGEMEFILKQNTEYAVILTADDDNDNVHTIILNWYCQTDE